MTTGGRIRFAVLSLAVVSEKPALSAADKEVIVPRRALAGRSILMVGDEPTNGFELQAALEQAGATVACADWARAGILVERPFLSAVVMDSGPSSRARREVIRRLRERCVPFLIYGAEPPATITSGQGAPFIANSAPPETVIATVIFLVKQATQTENRRVQN
jgi:CheY-like chemotaxis protein